MGGASNMPLELYTETCRIKWNEMTGRQTELESEWDREKIRALRQHLKATQQEMAEEMGTRQQTVSEWETGLYRPRGASKKMLSILAERSRFQYGTDGDDGEFGAESEPPPLGKGSGR